MSTTQQALAIAGTTIVAQAAALIEGSATLAELGRVASLSAGPMALAGATLLYSKPVGAGSDKVPGGKDFSKTLQIGELNLTTADIVGLWAQGEKRARSNIRGRLAVSDGAMNIELYKTEQPTEIRLLEGIPVRKGVFKCTVPATDDYPVRTIFVSPDRAPGAEGLGGLATPGNGPEAIADTGNQSQPVQLPTITIYPDLSETNFNDIIVLPPPDGGYEPIYVMLSSPRRAPGRADPNYRPNQDAVGTMGEFFAQPGFGSQLKASSRKTSQLYKGQRVYQATDDVGEHISMNDKFYLDSMHKDHLEIFDKKHYCRLVLNLDGSRNDAKTEKALEENRKLPK